MIFDTGWKEKGACRSQGPDLFFPDVATASGRREEKEAVKICKECSVRPQCLSHALAHEDFGVWGGMTERQRRYERKISGMKVDTERYLVANFIGNVRAKR
jgi:WhiB family redox-sensing transcriptional regulator